MNLFDSYLKYVEPFQGSTLFHKWALIGGVAALLERRVWIDHGGLGLLHPNLFVLLCGDPGSGKTVSMNVLIRFMKKYVNGVNYGPKQITPQQLLPRMQKLKKIVTGIPGIGEITQSAIFLPSAELSTLMKNVGGADKMTITNAEMFLDLYDCEDMFDKDLVKFDGKPLVVEYPCTNILCCTTPEFLGRYMTRIEAGSGLGSRFLMAVETVQRPRLAEIPPGDPILATQIGLQMNRIYGMKGEMRLTAAAKAKYLPWYEENEQIRASGKLNLFMKYFYTRRPYHAKKVAMSISAMRNNSCKVEAEDIELAANLIEEIEPNMTAAFGIQDFRSINDFAKYILEAIPHNSWATEAEIIQRLYTGGLGGSVHDFENHLRLLVDGKMVKERGANGSPRAFRRLV